MCNLDWLALNVGSLWVPVVSYAAFCLVHSEVRVAVFFFFKLFDLKLLSLVHY